MIWTPHCQDLENAMIWAQEKIDLHASSVSVTLTACAKTQAQMQKTQVYRAKETHTLQQQAANAMNNDV